MNGFIKLHRKFLGWWWYPDMVVKSVFLHIILTASYKDFEWKGKQYSAGQLVTTQTRLASELGLSVQQVRRALSNLRSSSAIDTQSTNAYTVITVLNWRVYQGESYEEQQTNRSHSSEKQQHIKNIKNIKNKEIRNSPLYPPKRGKGRWEENKANFGAYDLNVFEDMLDSGGSVVKGEEDALQVKVKINLP